jgi:hypothetical protein
MRNPETSKEPVSKELTLAPVHHIERVNRALRHHIILIRDFSFDC